MYEEFSSDYDRFVDWPARLAAEMPFIERELTLAGARRVLDAACGTGQHSLALAAGGYDVVGCDISTGMIDIARRAAAREGSTATFLVGGFGHLADPTGGGFDAVLCLGNSLPHVLSTELLARALQDFRSCLRSGGLLLIQNRNFDAVLACGDRWMSPQSHTEDGREWLFVRFYDFLDDGTIRFNLMTLRREKGGSWHHSIVSTRLCPLRQAELAQPLAEARFSQIRWWGDMEGSPFAAEASPNLVVTAHASQLERLKSRSGNREMEGGSQ